MGEFISFEEFKKMDIRIGKVVHAEKVLGTDRLIRLEVDLGKEKRQLVAGIGEQYSPEDLVGLEIVVLANLKPKKIRGLLSEGMLLAAVLEGHEPVLLIPDKEVPPGTPVS
ncbi:MAG TPA: methionine--tRNA ligase subunit beta [Candidatus Korarchaeota archaeon]|nr:methionine--tRNA ligase subunit beta [Candidatus Korarchaeota archaeon]